VLRVIAGSLKGRRLLTATWSGLRPTSDRLRETLFDILSPRMAGARVLDGYAGTGAIGIEALSRGASAVTFVDCDERAQALIETNLERCGVANGCAIIPADMAQALQMLRRASSLFDIIVLDPPYVERAPAIDAVIDLSAGVMADGGVLVFEHARARSTAVLAGQLVQTREVRAGSSALGFYERRDLTVRL
jgi:16S rRNA (guanine966-N2)-methyltransferase